MPEPIQMVVWAAGLIALGLVAVFMAKKFLENMTGDSLVILALRGLLFTAIDGVYHGIQDQLAQLPLNEQEDKVRELAKAAYAALPNEVVVKIRTMNIIIPLKLLMSEQMFCNLAWLGYQGAVDLVEQLQEMLKDAYEDWQNQGARLPKSKYTVPIIHP